MLGMLNVLEDIAKEAEKAALALDMARGKGDLFSQSFSDLIGKPESMRALRDFAPSLMSAREQLVQTYNAALFQAKGTEQADDANRLYTEGLKRLDTELEKTRRSQELDIQAIYAKTPAQKAAIAADRERVALMNTATDQAEIEIRVQAAYQQAYESSAFSISEATRQLRENVALEIQSINAKSPAQKAAIAAARERLSALNSGASAEEANTRAVLASGLAYAQAAHSIEESNRARLRSANDNNAQQRLEIDLIGASAFQRKLESASLQTKLDLQRQFMQTGVPAEERYLELLKAQNLEAAQLADTMAKRNLQADIDREKKYLGMSDAEANIARKLDGSGVKKEDYERYANQYREMDALQNSFFYGANKGFEEIIADANNFADSGKQLVTGLYSGLEDVWVNFAKTGKLSFSDLIDSMIEDLARLAYKARDVRCVQDDGPRHGWRHRHL